MRTLLDESDGNRVERAEKFVALIGEERDCTNIFFDAFGCGS